MTPTESALHRIEKALEALKAIDPKMSERALCRGAGLDEGAISSARSKQGGIGWNRLSPLLDELERLGINRRWVLWEEGNKFVQLHLGERASPLAPPIRRRKTGK